MYYLHKKRTAASKKHSSRSIHVLLSIPFSREDNSKDINSKTKYKKKTILISYGEPILKQKPIYNKNCH